MVFFGYSLLLVLFCVGLAFAQYIFWRKTGRIFWRAILPFELRQAWFPQDSVRLDPWMALEEWSAMLLLGGYLTLPVVALNFMGFISIFPK